MIPLLAEFRQSLSEEKSEPMERRITVACRPEDYVILSDLSLEVMDYFAGLEITVMSIPVEGEEPATMEELMDGLCFEDLGEELLLLNNLPKGLDFLEELECNLEVKVTVVPCLGRELLHALIAKENH